MPIIHRLLALPKGRPSTQGKKPVCFLCHDEHVHAHGSYLRNAPDGHCGADHDLVEIPRFLCLKCRRTFSLLPWFLIRRIRAPLPLLLIIVQTKRTWEKLFENLEIAWNTLWSWKKKGKALLVQIPSLLETAGNSWTDFSMHLSRLQYPNNLRKVNHTIP